MGDPTLLFDTGALIDVYHGRERMRPHFERLITDSFVAYLSPISEAELWFGLRSGELARHEALLSFFIPLTLTSEAGRLAGEWMRRYRAKGLGWMDALIVASAAIVGARVLTRDERLVNLLDKETEFVVYA